MASQKTVGRHGDANARIQFDEVTFELDSVHGGRFRILDGLSFQIVDGEFVCMLGRSGCGKTSTLLLAAGFAGPTAGSVAVSGRDGAAAPVLVSQSDSVFPWMTVEGNLLFAMRHGQNRQALSLSLEEHLRVTGLTEFRSFYPREISGGMRKRLEIARGWLSGGDLLLDEPLGQLDAFTRQEMQLLLQDLWLLERRTILMVTHSIEESLFLADRILVMRGPPGRIQHIQPVPFARPRKTDLLFDPEFQRLRRELFLHLERHDHNDNA